jgi:hypothetical protein
VECILKTQVVQEGKLTVWCAQHDERTLALFGIHFPISFRCPLPVASMTDFWRRWP